MLRVRSTDSDELAAALHGSRALPPAVLDAADPADVYPIESLVPRTVLSSLNTRHLLKTASQGDLGKALRLPPHSSSWLLPRLWQTVQAAQNDAGSTSTATERVRVGYYVSLLLNFRRHARALNRGEDGVAAVADKMRLPDHERDIVMEHLVAQFAEQARGSHRYVTRALSQLTLSASVTATGETRLLAHILVLALHLDDFSVAPQPLAQELGVPVSRYVFGICPIDTQCK